MKLPIFNSPNSPKFVKQCINRHFILIKNDWGAEI